MISINKNSLIFKCAKIGDEHVSYNRNDICSFTRAVLLGIVNGLFIVCTSVFLVASFADMVAWIIVMLIYGTVFEFGGLAFMAILASALIVTITVVASIIVAFQKATQADSIDTLRHIINAKMDKYCTPVKYVNKE